MKYKAFIMTILITYYIVGIPLIALPQTHAQSDQKQWLLARINTLRSQLGIHAYVWNDQLAAAAQQQSDYMASTLDISHVQSNGSTPASRASAQGYTGSWVSENIYWGTSTTPESAFNWWANSPVHYAGMTHQRNNEIGIGVTLTDRGGFYVLVFGYRASVQAPPAQPQINNAPVAPPANTAQGNSNPAPPPIRRPPTLTFTPSPTIPTLTPTITWTPTPTWTPTSTTTLEPPTLTPFNLPTAAIVAMASTPTDDLTTPKSPSFPSVSPTRESNAKTDNYLLPIFLAVQFTLIGAGLYSIFFRKYSRK